MKTDILGNDVRIGDTVRFMQIKYREFMDGTIVSMADTSALISHEPTNTCRTKSRQCYDQMISLSALERNRRAKQENRPLTLEELYRVDNEPLYFFHTVGHWSLNGWHIVTPLSYSNHSFKDLRLDNNDNHIIDTFNYGITWLAYREKPKEDV